MFVKVYFIAQTLNKNAITGEAGWSGSYDSTGKRYLFEQLTDDLILEIQKSYYTFLNLENTKVLLYIFPF